MTHCPFTDRLPDLLAGRPSGTEASEVEAHVETCAGCQQALERLTAVWPELEQISADVRVQLEVDARYAVYVRRQADDIAQLKRREATVIPVHLDFGSIPGLSTEVRQKLERHRPGTLAQAAKIDGMTPAALLILSARLAADAAGAGRRTA